MTRSALIAAIATITLLAPVGGSVLAETPAKELFGGVATPAPLEARAIGFYSRGCLAGAAPLAVTGEHWQAMRLSRNRNWGHPVLIDYIQRLAADANRLDGWRGLLVGDLAQPRGGPMLTGHASHQIGLDADIWLTEMPDRVLSAQEREDISAISMLKDGTLYTDPAKFSDGHKRVIARAASYPEVARIFVHPGIKRGLCEWADRTGMDRGWLRKVRPWYGHHYHFHIRLSCPAGMAGCRDQDPPPAGDGCGSELAWWFTEEPWKPNPNPAPPKPPMTMSALPDACRTVLNAVALSAEDVPLPRPRPR